MYPVYPLLRLQCGGDVTGDDKFENVHSLEILASGLVFVGESERGAGEGGAGFIVIPHTPSPAVAVGEDHVRVVAVDRLVGSLELL